jgi:tetratricopeptide (TPR) repeat protein
MLVAGNFHAMKGVGHWVCVVLLVCAIGLGAQAQNTVLDSAKVLVATNKTREAIPVLERLIRTDSEVAAHNYFLGQCLVREGIRIGEAIKLLEKAARMYNELDVDPGMNEPELVHFYLVIAYSRDRQCDNALQRYYELVEVYSKGDPFYPKEAMKWVELCHEPQRLVQEVETRNMAEVKPHNLKDRLVAVQSLRDSVVTRPKEFSTRSVLYGVQVGALLKPTYTVHFPGLKNVGVYVDENGIYRYVVGNLSYRSQAEKLLHEVRGAGYPDAFIVDINNPVRYRDEVVLLNEVSIQRELSGKVEFRVQIGAFAEVLPERLAQLYLQLEGLSELRTNDLTLMTVGPYDSYAQAQTEKERLSTMGFADAFVTAFNQGQRIPTGMAVKYLENQQK